ncbi:MAG: hypothetical protein QF918_15655 [Pirellulaceae bacterium]|nr:hypothetical protein [Pirellulaceae bacterium]MDP6555950.1 hypothetical protein [Pirellulaceae bacterium]
MKTLKQRRTTQRGGRFTSRVLSVIWCIALAPPLVAQDSLEDALGRALIPQKEATEQLNQFVLSRITKLKTAESTEAWQKESARIRERVREEVIFRGVPTAWREGKPRVVWDDVIETDHGYRIRKLRFEALPGLWIPALLYEPAKFDGKVPAVLNVNGHEATGKSTAYKQLRCINLAKRGILALNLEWIGMGQLRTPGLSHNHLAKLDLCGRAGVGVFFLAMSRGIDLLLDHPHADPTRTAVTGLSGGGWQTIILSSLDTRVKLAVPVAGHSALAQRVANANSIGDLEQNPSDLASIADYVHLNCLMVPRPLLLIYNTRDNCCFVASTVKSNTYEPVVPFYKQAGVPDRLGYYENDDPGTHNYEKDNREHLYGFLNKHFLPSGDQSNQEIVSADEVRTDEELSVPLPENNADFHSLAAAAARTLPVPLTGSKDERREQLRKVLRFRPHDVTADLFTGPKPFARFKVRDLRLRVGDEWILPAMVVEGQTVDRQVIVLADGGFASQTARIEALAASGARVLAIDPILIGQTKPARQLYQNAMLLATVGQRPLGIQSAQIAAVAKFFARVFVAESVIIEAHGPRSSLIARCAAALDGGVTIGKVQTNAEPASLKDFLQPGAGYAATPEAYCFGLLEHFDLPQLVELAND